MLNIVIVTARRKILEAAEFLYSFFGNFVYTLNKIPQSFGEKNMQRIIILLTILFLFANTVLSSPLIFKVTKEINTKDLIELGSFDATKYKQIRIGVKFTSTNPDSVESTPAYRLLVSTRVELIVKLAELEMSFRENHPEILSTQKKIDKIEDEVANLAKLQNEELKRTIKILGVEGKDEILLYSSDGKNTSFSTILESPPSKIIIKAKGEGNYSLYVWASQ